MLKDEDLFALVAAALESKDASIGSVIKAIRQEEGFSLLLGRDAAHYALRALTARGHHGAEQMLRRLEELRMA